MSEAAEASQICVYSTFKENKEDHTELFILITSSSVEAFKSHPHEGQITVPKCFSPNEYYSGHGMNELAV